MTATFTESVIEQAALGWLEGVGWQVRHGAEIAPGEPGAERGDYRQVILEQRLRDALGEWAPKTPAPPQVLADAGEIMPPKSTWFEPKLRDGLLIHEI